MGSVVKTNGNNSDSLHTGGGHAVTIGTIGNVPSLDRFQVIPNGKSRVEHINYYGTESISSEFASMSSKHILEAVVGTPTMNLE